MWVFDATPLIYLAKAGRVSLVGDLDGHRVIPQLVYEEVVETGLAEGYPDARRVDRAIDDGLFTVESHEDTPLVRRLTDNQNLSPADVAVLGYAAAHDAVAVMDETYGRDVATTEEITTRGTAYIVLALAQDGVVTPEEARTTIDTMVDSGWYCAPDMYAAILRKLEEIQE